MKKRTGFGLLVAISFGLSLPLTALAASPSHIDTAAVNVSFADLNIANETGAKLLYARLERASQEVCGVGSHNSVRSLTETKNVRACYEKALSAAVEKLDSELLTSIHNS